jgi:signal transduction histidine kinase
LKEPIDAEQALLTEIQRLQARVAALEQQQADSILMDEFLNIVSHELRTPLTAINGNVQLAKRRLNVLISADDLNEEILENLDIIQELLGRAESQVRIQNRLVTDMLDASRIQSNKMNLRMVDSDLVHIVNAVVEEQRAINPSRAILLTTPPVAPIPIVVDPSRIRQVLSNYLSNALRYSGSDRPVSVWIEVQDRTASVFVQDAGPGIPPEIISNIWRRFYHAPQIKAQNGSDVGLGMGLYMSKILIERHQGQVGVESTPGTGSIFWFALPIKR